MNKRPSCLKKSDWKFRINFGYFIGISWQKVSWVFKVLCSKLWPFAKMSEKVSTHKVRFTLNTAFDFNEQLYEKDKE